MQASSFCSTQSNSDSLSFLSITHPSYLRIALALPSPLYRRTVLVDFGPCIIPLHFANVPHALV